MEIREYAGYLEEEVAALYASVGWTAYTDDLPALRRGFAGSLLVLAAYEGEELVGIIRLVGDGATIVFIQDLLVDPRFQRRGIGRALMEEALARYRHVRQIELAADRTEETLAFYRSLGFKELSELGCRGFMFAR